VLGLGAWGLIEFVGFDVVRQAVEEGWTALQAAPPLVFFSVTVLVTLLPLPMSLMYITAGTIYGIVPSLLWTVPTLFVSNLIWHGLGTSFLRPALARLVRRRGVSIPTLQTPSDQALFTTLIRVTPGIPYFLQNVVLALAGIEFIRFVAISIFVQMFWALGWLVLGRSAFEGEAGLAVTGVAIIVAGTIVARWMRRRLQRSTDIEVEAE
jgi:uncharacterized membrane protein YdjX (TVP38/TMEM64 family)